MIAWNWGAKAGLFYAGTNLLCNIWCWFRLPETKDRTFGEIDLLFDNHVPARKFKYTKVNRKPFFPPMASLLMRKTPSPNAESTEFAHQSEYREKADIISDAEHIEVEKGPIVL